MGQMPRTPVRQCLYDRKKFGPLGRQPIGIPRRVRLIGFSPNQARDFKPTKTIG